MMRLIVHPTKTAIKTSWMNEENPFSVLKRSGACLNKLLIYRKKSPERPPIPLRKAETTKNMTKTSAIPNITILKAFIRVQNFSSEPIVGLSDIL